VALYKRLRAKQTSADAVAREVNWATKDRWGMAGPGVMGEQTVGIREPVRK
jgi:hypothetical protein